MLRAGANPNVRAKGLGTPLHLATAYGHLHCARAIICGARKYLRTEDVEYLRNGGIDLTKYQVAEGERMTRQRRVIGGVLKVPLGDGWHAYAWTLPEVDFALFDLRTDAEMPAVEVVTHPVAFRVMVNGSAYLDGLWPRIGKVTPPPEVLTGADVYSGPVHRPVLDLLGRRHSPGYPCRVHWSGVLCRVGTGACRGPAPGSLRRSPV